LGGLAPSSFGNQPPSIPSTKPQKSFQPPSPHQKKKKKNKKKKIKKKNYYIFNNFIFKKIKKLNKII